MAALDLEDAAALWAGNGFVVVLARRVREQGH